jgi:hypothetical protein
LLHEWISTYLDWMIIGLLVVLVLIVILYLIAARRQRKIYMAYKQLLKGTQPNTNLEALLMKNVEDIHQIEFKLREYELEVTQLRKELESKLDPAGIIRYNAFLDGGSDLSFSIALLNQKQNGVVITSLYGREDSRVYAKPILEGKSTYPLTDEEKSAISKVIQ